MIANEVKSGKVKLVYKSFETATANGPDADQWSNQQSAAYAAGAQGKAWNYILLFYRDQGTEDTNYVNTAYLTGLAKQIPGLNYQKWNTDRFNPAYGNLVAHGEQDGGVALLPGPSGHAGADRHRTEEPDEADLGQLSVQLRPVDD